MTTERTERKPYPSDVSDEEWALVAPYLTLMSEDAPQREHPLREVFNGLRWIVRTGAQWRWMPHDLPPSAPGHSGAGCPTTCRPGTPCTSRHSAGCARACLRTS